jgi:hypothetical protein
MRLEDRQLRMATVAATSGTYTFGRRRLNSYGQIVPYTAAEID